MNFFDFFKGANLGIDLGTANTLIYKKGEGIVLREPSIVAMTKNSGKVLATGNEAKRMLGKTPEKMVAVMPLRDGVIADFDAAEKMLETFLRRALGNNTWVRPRVVIGIPSGITQVEKRAVRDVALRVRAREVYMVEQSMAAAIGAGLPVEDPTGSMVVDIGGGTTDVAVISLAGVVRSKTIRVAGNEMDEAIRNYLKLKYHLLVGERTAEQIKIELGNAIEPQEPREMEIRGRDLKEGLPRNITITDVDVKEALDPVIKSIVNAIKETLEDTPPELSADILERGIVITGGGSLLRNLDKRISEETKLPVEMARDPLSCVVLGVGKILDDMDLLKRVSIG